MGVIAIRLFCRSIYPTFVGSTLVDVPKQILWFVPANILTDCDFLEICSERGAQRQDPGGVVVEVRTARTSFSRSISELCKIGVKAPTVRRQPPKTKF